MQGSVHQSLFDNLGSTVLTFNAYMHIHPIGSQLISVKLSMRVLRSLVSKGILIPLKLMRYMVKNVCMSLIHIFRMKMQQSIVKDTKGLPNEFSSNISLEHCQQLLRLNADHVVVFSSSSSPEKNLDKFRANTIKDLKDLILNFNAFVGSNDDDTEEGVTSAKKFGTGFGLDVMPFAFSFYMRDKVFFVIFEILEDRLQYRFCKVIECVKIEVGINVRCHNHYLVEDLDAMRQIGDAEAIFMDIDCVKQPASTHHKQNLDNPAKKESRIGNRLILGSEGLVEQALSPLEQSDLLSDSLDAIIFPLMSKSLPVGDHLRQNLVLKHLPLFLANREFMSFT
ncbi:hypothetical protein Tco_0309180 [Tanacetum coccineum]